MTLVRRALALVLALAAFLLIPFAGIEAASAATPAPAQTATVQASALPSEEPINMTSVCRTQYPLKAYPKLWYVKAELNGTTAFDWRCVGLFTGVRGYKVVGGGFMDLLAYCQGRLFRGVSYDYSDPNSWKCWRY